MKVNKVLQQQYFEIVENQIKSNDPPETKINFERLKKEGYSDFEVKQLIGQCIALETFLIIKYNKEFDKERFIRNLNNRPKEPQEN